MCVLINCLVYRVNLGALVHRLVPEQYVSGSSSKWLPSYTFLNNFDVFCSSCGINEKWGSSIKKIDNEK
jgi:hypothetical protein